MSIVDILAGASLVSLGVLVTAAADRLRGIRTVRYVEERTSATRAPRTIDTVAQTAPAAPTARSKAVRAPADGDRDRADVVQALIAAGYARAVAAAAVDACSSPERMNLGTWTKAALRRCMVAA